MHCKKKRISFYDSLQIAVGSKRDFKHFSKWHYRGHSIGITTKVFLLLHDKDPIGILVFGPASLASSNRNKLFGKSKWSGKVINEKFINLARVVIDPRYRGCGIVTPFLKTAFSFIDKDWIELITSMQDATKCFTNAGFICCGKTQGKANGSRECRVSKETVLQSSLAQTTYFLFDNRK